MACMYDFPPGLDRIAGEPDEGSFAFSNVLLVEDDPGHAALITRALKGLADEVVHARNGAEAIELLESELAEVVFCDLHLPDISGSEVIAKIKKMRPGLPIIVVTSSSNLDDAVKAMREGAWDYLVKNFSEQLKPQIAITLRRAAERKQQMLREVSMRKQMDAFSVAAFAAQDGLAILGEGGAVVFANEAFHNFCQLLKQGGEETNVIDLVAARNYSVARALHNTLHSQSAGTLWSSELEIALRDDQGKEHLSYFELQLSGVSPGGGREGGELLNALTRFWYRVLWVRDITRRKEQERFQRDLLSTTTHDLKGPLGAILTSAELLSEPHFDPDSKALDLLTRIASCARSSINLIDELLSARRIQDGVLVVRPRWLDLEELASDLVLDYEPVAKTKAIALTAKTAEPNLAVYADKLGLERVLGNLVNNALKFTQRAGKVHIHAERVGSETRISVSDTGPGIEPRMRHRLFERFARAERDSEIKGTGIGLFVTKNIVEAHNGRIEVKSELGCGTTFIVTLPDGPRPE